MGNLTASNVSTGKGNPAGYLFCGATSATLPTDATTAISTSAFTSLGYVSDDGVTNEFSRESEDIKDWNGATVLSAQTEVNDAWKMTLLESKNADVLKAIYGDSNVTVTSGALASVAVDATEPINKAFIIDMITSDGGKKRVVIPNGKITEVGEITYAAGEAISYEITITCMPNASGKLHYEYFAAAG